MKGIPILDDETLARARRAIGQSEEEISSALTPDEHGGRWFSDAPGLYPLKLAYAVLSTAYYEYVKEQPLSPAERKALERIRILPQDQALAEIKEGRWDPPYSE